MSKNQKGFALVEAALVLVVAAIVAGTGYYVWHTKKKTDESLNSTAKTSLNVPKGSVIKNYDDCVKSPGSIEQETYPPVCVTKAGQKFTQAGEQTVSWTQWIAPDSSFKMKIPDGWNLDQNSLTTGNLQTYDNDLEIKSGIKGTFYVTPGYGKDSNSGLFIEFIDPNLSDSNYSSWTKVGTKEGSLSTYSGLEIQKFYHLQTDDSVGPGLRKGGQSYVYAIFNEKKLVLTAYFINPGQTDYHVNLEAALKTVEVP